MFEFEPKYLFLLSVDTSQYRFEYAVFINNVFKSVTSNNNYDYSSHINTSTLNKNVLSWYSLEDAMMQANEGNIYYACLG